MQAGVHPLIVFDMDRNLWLLFAFGDLNVGKDNVIGLAGRDTLGEFAVVVGHSLPAGFLLVGAANLDGNTIGRTTVGSPDGAEY